MSTIRITPPDNVALTEQKRVERLRQAHVDANQPVTVNLVKVLKAFAEEGRPAYEERIAASLILRAQGFVNARKNKGVPNITIEEMNARPHREDGESSEDYARRCRHRPQYDLQFVLEYTDYPRAKGPNDTEYALWVKNKERPAFKVALLPNAKEIAAKQAKLIVDQIVRWFVQKTLHKVIDILVKKPKYTATLLSSKYTAGSLEADIALEFADKTSVRTHLIVKTNYRDGCPYTQYPLTFHDFVAEPGGKATGASLDYIMQRWGIPVWIPEKPKAKPRRWDAVKTGCVVLTQDGRLALVDRIGIPKELKGQIKEWNKHLADLEAKEEELERKYNALDDREMVTNAEYKKLSEARSLAFDAAHKYKYTTLPTLKASLDRAFVTFADGSEGQLAAAYMKMILAKVDEGRPVDKSKLPQDSLFYGFVEASDGDCYHVGFNKADCKPYGVEQLDYSGRPPVLRTMTFKRIVPKLMEMLQDLAGDDAGAEGN